MVLTGDGNGVLSMDKKDICLAADADGMKSSSPHSASCQETLIRIERDTKYMLSMIYPINVAFIEVDTHKTMSCNKVVY